MTFSHCLCTDFCELSSGHSLRMLDQRFARNSFAEPVEPLLDQTGDRFVGWIRSLLGLTSQ